MDQSLRNHAMLVQHQNEQQQQQRQQRRAEEYYRNNHGIQIPPGGSGGVGVVRGSSSSQASGSNKSSRGSNSVSSGSKQSRTSGSGSGKSARSGTRNSGTAGSDDAIGGGGGGGGGLGASLAAHHNRDHRQHRQQQQQPHRQQQQQRYQQQQQQHGMTPQQYRQQLGTVPQHQQYEQQYQQQEQHYNNDSQPQQEQYLQEQYLQQQYEQQQQQYELQQQYEQQQLQQQYERQQQQQQESQHYHGSYSSQISQSQYSQSQYSQQSQSQQSYYIDYQSQGGGGGGQAGGTVQSHYSSIYGSVTGGASQAQQSQGQQSQAQQSQAQSQASTARSAAVDEAYRRLGQKLSRSVHGDDISSASSARGQPHNRIHQQHPVRIGSVNNPSSVFVPYNKGAAVEQQEKEQRQKQQRPTSEDDNGKGNVVRKLTANANDLFRLWHTEYQRTNPNKNTSNLKVQQQHQRRQPQSNQNHDRDHDVSPDRRAFAQMTLAGGGSSSSSNNNNNNNNTIGDAHNNNNNNNSSHHHISSHNHNHNNHNSIYHQRRGSLSAVIESDSCTNKRSSSDSSNGRSRATNNTNINQRSTQSVGDGGRGDNDNSIIASSSIGTRASSIGTRTCNSSRSHNALPPPRGKCLTQPSEGVSGTNYNLCDNTEGNLIVYKNDTLSVPRKQVHVLNNKTNSNDDDDGSKIRQSGSGASAYTDFRVRSLLGQGTFAQVFKCLNSQTGKYVAVKIVKAKPAYTRQAAIEIDVIRALTTSTSSSGNDGSSSNTDSYMVDMVCYFMYKDHLCLVFELLGMNLYEVLKKRQFRGLPLGVVQTMVRQAVLGARALGQKSIVHCDLKPENILLVDDDDAESVMSAGDSKRTAIQVEETGKSAAATAMAVNSDGNDDASLSTITTTVMAAQKIKLIDFGSACFEGQMSHTYIQSRFYRSPEVLIGLAYDSAIDMWSLGCVAAELFLGLPILPGVHEHNQLGRISEMIGDTPDWMLDQGSKTSKFFVKFVPAPTPTPTPPAPSATNPRSPSPIPPESRPGSQPPRPLPQWRIKTQQEYIASLSQKDIKKKGGLTKLEKQPGNRYFKRTRLSDIVLDKGQSGKQEDVRLLQYFVHFLYGILDPDPWKRWTASQVVNHPFLTGATMEANTGPIKDDNQANIILNLYWEAPSDPTIYRRKLLNVQKTREKQQAARRGQHRSYSRNRSRSESPYSQDGLPTVRSVSSETLSVSSYSDDFTNQTAAGPQMRPGSYQMSSSMTQFGNNQGVQLTGYNSAAAGTQSIMYGPQSYSEAGNSVNLPGSFAEVDFALALQRPGVVPGPGDSVTTSSMTASTSATTMSSNNSRSTYHHTNLGSQSGSYGTHQVLQNGNHQQRRFPMATSRSFGEGDVTATSRVPAEIDSRHQQVVYASSHDSGIYIGPPPTELKAENIPNNLPLAMSTPPAPPAALGSTTQLPMQYTVPLNNSSAAVTSNNTGIQNPNMGNYDPQAYQQQLAMMQHQFQQQQILLQQQQAALALQQQQLEQYSMNQALMNPNIPNAAAAGMNTGGAPAAVQGGGYYVVTADDGTSRLVAASNLGMAIPMSGQVAGIGAPGQIQGQGIATPNNQTTGDGFYTNNSNHQHQHPHQQP